MEAGCLEWSLLISILLRDAMAVLRTVNAAKPPDQSIESVSRLRQGLLILNYWTNTECLGYKAFMLAIQNQISVLSRILETKIQQQQITEYQRAVSASLNEVASPVLSRSRKTSSNQDNARNSHPILREKKIPSVGGNTMTDKLNEAVANNVTDGAVNGQLEKNGVAEGSGCVIA
ncbi:unnamed protein product [Acanthoscelides obtectus]|nr:unnamed protein product [Acanthoscelides obtectus]CAK1659011.1 RAB6A-GEF complex partner protein 1 [Acanthoscelides obtectus]